MRKDGKSQYQLKKEKLKQIKYLIKWRAELWRQIKEKTYKGDYNEPLLMPQNVIERIWELVKDE